MVKDMVIIFWLWQLFLPLNIPHTNLSDKTKLITTPTFYCPLDLDNFQTPTTELQNTIMIYTVGSKFKHGLGADIVFFQADFNNKL